MKIMWTSDLATGIEIIDAQHRELFDRVNRLLEACVSRRGAEEVLVTLRFLENYVIEHFGMEEEVMRMSGYEGLEQHRGLHADFRSTISGLLSEVETNGTGLNMVVQVNRLVVDWLNQHVRKADRAAAAAIRGWNHGA